MIYRRLILILLTLTFPLAGVSGAEQPMRVLTSASRPHLELEIDASFTALPRLLFPLQFSNVDRRIFVEADKSRIVQRMIVVQFEKVRNGSRFKFVYPPKPPIVFGSETYRFGAYVYDDAKSAASQPGMEAARTRSAIGKLGYHLPRLFRTARLARVADPLGQSEVIIFYFENADASYLNGVLPNADADGDLALCHSAAQSLFESMKAVIHPITG
jgi:hypothetical protein